MVKFATEEWMKEFCRAMNENEKFRKASEKWETPILFIVDDKSKYLEADVFRGECRGTREVSSPEESKAGFHLSATYDNWAKIARGELGPAKAITIGKMKVVKGSKMKVLTNIGLFLAMVDAIRSIDSITEY
ncbi:SCP2 sterol-binding domain-containing protein [Candidatus Alkanophaga liquidiphilum]|nr:MAG: hypothetical protein DRN91_04635 [Candidatus Alkanophagales archaeon]